MKCYLENGSELVFNNDLFNRVNKGSGGVIYKLYNDKCVKLYYLDTIFKIEKEIFDIMKELDLDNFCKLGNMIYNKDNKLMGYTMNYYESIDCNILFMSGGYILDNFNKLYNSYNILSDNKILANDTRLANCVIGNDITMIDFDFYLKSDLSIDRIKELNISKLMLLFNQMCYKYYSMLYGDVPINIEYKLDDIFCYDGDPVKKLKKVFNYNDRIIDVINK